MKKYAPLLKKEHHTFHKQPAFVYNQGGRNKGRDGEFYYIYCEKCHTWHKFYYIKEIEDIRRFKGRKYCNDRIQCCRIAWDILEHREDFPTMQDILNKYGKVLKKLLNIKEPDLKPGERTDTCFPPLTLEEVFDGYPKQNHWITTLLNDYVACISVSSMTDAFDPYAYDSFSEPMESEVPKNHFYSQVVPALQKIIRYYADKNAVNTPKVSNRFWWNGNYFKCPSCGAQGLAKHMTGSRPNIYPVNATVFSMEDGSKTVSFIMREEIPLKVKVTNSKEFQEKPLYRYRELQGRIVFSADGHTYIKAPVELGTKKVVENNDALWSYKSNIADVTYSSTSKGPFYEVAIKAMEEEGVLPANYAAINRFRNTSKQFTDCLQQHLSETRCGRKMCEKFALNFLRQIDKNDDDLQILNNISKKYKLPKSKKFKKALMDDVYITTKAFKAWKGLGFKDINAFYKILENVNLRNSIFHYYFYSRYEMDAFKGFVQKYLRVGSEMSFVKALGNTLVNDAIRIHHGLQDSDITEEDISRCFKPSIKKTHDALVALADVRREMEIKIQAQQNIDEQVQLYKQAKQDGKKTMAGIAMREIVQNKLEKDGKILYTEEEVRKYEKEINGFKFILPRKTADLVAAGKKLHNCVGHCYLKPALCKTSTIVLMEKDENLCGCIEIHNNTIRQAYGPCNNKLKDDVKAAFETWRVSCGIMENLVGAVLPADDATIPKDLVRKIWAEIVEEYNLQEYKEAA
jgi:hypothetical protein